MVWIEAPVFLHQATGLRSMSFSTTAQHDVQMTKPPGFVVMRPQALAQKPFPNMYYQQMHNNSNMQYLQTHI